jgi:hypothetical protein
LRGTLSHANLTLAPDVVSSTHGWSRFRRNDGSAPRNADRRKLGRTREGAGQPQEPTARPARRSHAWRRRRSNAEAAHRLGRHLSSWLTISEEGQRTAVRGACSASHTRPIMRRCDIARSRARVDACRTSLARRPTVRAREGELSSRRRATFRRPSNASTHPSDVLHFVDAPHAATPASAPSRERSPPPPRKYRVRRPTKRSSRRRALFRHRKTASTHPSDVLHSVDAARATTPTRAPSRERSTPPPRKHLVRRPTKRSSRRRVLFRRPKTASTHPYDVLHTVDATRTTTPGTVPSRRGELLSLGSTSFVDRRSAPPDVARSSDARRPLRHDRMTFCTPSKQRVRRRQEPFLHAEECSSPRKHLVRRPRKRSRRRAPFRRRNYVIARQEGAPLPGPCSARDNTRGALLPTPIRYESTKRTRSTFPSMTLPSTVT